MPEAATQKTPQSPRRQFTGVVVSHSEKTAAVRVERVRVHTKYHKRYSLRTTFLAHDPTNTAQIGQTVTIVETRPSSRRKRFRVLIPHRGAA